MTSQFPDDWGHGIGCVLVLLLLALFLIVVRIYG